MESRFNYSHLSSSIKDILFFSKPMDRTKEEIDKIITELSDFPIFKTIKNVLGIEQLYNIVNIMTIKSFPKFQAIATLGEIPTDCYIILEGHANVFIPQIKSVEHNEKDIIMVKVGEVRQGYLFGEKSLMTKGVRNASIITNEKSIIASISKKEYLLYFNKLILQEQNEDFKIYRSMNFFKDKSKAFIEKFIYGMEKIDLCSKQTIIEQKSPITNVYIIRKGFVKLYYQNCKKKSINYNIDFFLNGQEHNKHQDRFTSERCYELNGYKDFYENRELFVLGKGEIIGDIELCFNMENSLFTAMSLESGTQVLVCSRVKFLSMIGHYIKEFKYNLISKINSIKERINTICTYRKKHISLIEEQFNLSLSKKVKNIATLSFKQNEYSESPLSLLHNKKGKQMKNIGLILKSDKRTECEISQKLRDNINNKLTNCNNSTIKRIVKQPTECSTINTIFKVKNKLDKSCNHMNHFSPKRNDKKSKKESKKKKNNAFRNEQKTNYPNKQYTPTLYSSISAETIFHTKKNLSQTIELLNTNKESTRLYLLNNEKIELNIKANLISKRLNQPYSTINSDCSMSNKRAISISLDTVSPEKNQNFTSRSCSRANHFLIQEINNKKIFRDKDSIKALLKDKYSLLRKNSHLRLCSSKTKDK